jgi:hypothetical protein
VSNEYFDWRIEYNWNREHLDSKIAEKILGYKVLGKTWVDGDDGVEIVETVIPDWVDKESFEPVYLHECKCEETRKFFEKNDDIKEFDRQSIFGHHHWCLKEVPHYHRDLELCHELEQKLIEQKMFDKYIEKLIEISIKESLDRNLVYIDAYWKCEAMSKLINNLEKEKANVTEK